MIPQQIDYASLVEQALLRVVHDVLAVVAEHGLPGRHHLYLTFRTDHPGVLMDDTLHARYPGEMTIVLQHEYWGLEVTDERFAVTLSFSGAPQRIEVPFAAVTVFADPSVEFGLQFTRAAAPAAEAGAPGAAPGSVNQLPGAAEKAPDQQGQHDVAQAPAEIDEAAMAAEDRAEQAPQDAPEQDGEGVAAADKVVTLDRFRKK